MFSAGPLLGISLRMLSLFALACLVFVVGTLANATSFNVLGGSSVFVSAVAAVAATTNLGVVTLVATIAAVSCARVYADELGQKYSLVLLALALEAALIYSAIISRPIVALAAASCLLAMYRKIGVPETGKIGS